MSTDNENNLPSIDSELIQKYYAEERSQKTGVVLDAFGAGDATRLEAEDGRFDLALLLGPLYHLTERDLRIQALAEAARVVKPGGVVICAVISRYASLIDGYNRDLISDPEFEKILIQDLRTGIHENRTENPDYFTTAYFHTPGEIKEEIAASGLVFEKLIALESFGWIIKEFGKKSEDAVYLNRLLHTIRLVEEDENIMAMSPHILGIARKGSTS